MRSRLRSTNNRGRSTGTWAGALLAALLLAGCTGDAELQSGGEQGFVSANGAVSRAAVDEREKPGRVVEGETLEGEAVSLEDYAGQVVVLNIWGSWCGPCIREAPHLVEAAEELQGPDVAFLGINTRDLSRDPALAFERKHDIPYPSLYDPAGEVLLAFRSTIPPSSIPSTLIVDREGRIAARVLGEVTASTLVGLVEDVLSDG
ncbi:thiol-disulfide isomerase/thioredoxin [Nocardioides massiliensis]|uniref:Thiol-disulfide isomerase/thioredoxin n=2 Tax=Nocardioides massiliensis TaxID=1325935 RepID=A0ABT9NMY5_9ACTN|nr:TlpA disulfide reductase family protein [Nocardioides massiliensis]MDP9821686.1 thiol-disulfide isomerase/thioredoxin [Nocardioides massiliensis]